MADLVAAQTPAWTFTQGFLAGQATVVVLALLFVRYVVFSASDTADAAAWRARRKAAKELAELSTTPVPPPPTAHLLDKTGYDMATHAAETADWINVLGAQVGSRLVSV